MSILDYFKREPEPKTPEQIMNESIDLLVRKVIPQRCIDKMVLHKKYIVFVDNKNTIPDCKYQLDVTARTGKPPFTMAVWKITGIHRTYMSQEDICKFLISNIGDVVNALKRISDMIEDAISEKEQHSRCANTLYDKVQQFPTTIRRSNNEMPE